MKSKKGVLIGIATAIILASVFLFFANRSKYNFSLLVYKPQIPVLEYGIPVDYFEVKTGVVKPNQVLSQLLASIGATTKNINQLSLLKQEDFDVRTVRAGNPYKAFYSLDSTRTLCYFVYEQSPVQYSTFWLKDTFKVVQGKKPVTIEERYGEATITSSLWNAVASSGINRVLALNLSDMYAWSIDFFGLQKGDSFKAIYDEQYIDGTTPMGIGRIHAACFTHRGKPYYAFYFIQDGIGSYWDEQGNSLKKAFLKAPLKFSRISSHFSHARKHPVLRIVRPHHGVDYAAPKGTPVMAIGDGTVVEKGYKGGGGNTVKIKHNSIYTTAYLHLSGYGKGIAVGSRVGQGQIIGYVGSTGLSTGPHLDFRVWKSGQAINPLQLESPPAEPIHEKNRHAFDSVVHQWTTRLNKQQALPHTDSTATPS